MEVKSKYIGVTAFLSLFLAVGSAWLMLRHPKPIQLQAQVQITKSGFEPTTLQIKSGTKVTWTNTDSSSQKVASNPHPAHTGLKGLESPTLKPNQTYSFSFKTPGRFGYHDHLHPTINAVIVVTP